MPHSGPPLQQVVPHTCVRPAEHKPARPSTITSVRIISLLASATEIVCALGAGEMLVGRSHECDNPDWVRRLPPCSEPAFDVSVSSREIDAEVRRRIRSGEPLYHLNAKLIDELRPDLLITQEHCEVCAITPGDVERSGACAAKQLALSASSLDDIFQSILRISQAIGLPDEGKARCPARTGASEPSQAGSGAFVPENCSHAGVDRPACSRWETGARNWSRSQTENF